MQTTIYRGTRQTLGCRTACGALLVGLLLLPSATLLANELDADSIMQRNFFATKIKTLQSTAEMVLINDRGQKRERSVTLTAKLQSNGVDANLVIKFRSPADIAGTAFLQLQHIDSDDDLWIYLPALKKSRRLVANNKKDSFFGTDFAYADILPPKVESYRYKLLGAEVVDDHDCYVIESVPINASVEDDIGYGRKVYRIRKDNFVEAKVEYFDAAGRLLKTQTTSDHQLVEPESRRWIVRKRVMINHRTGHSTIFVTTAMQAGTDIANSVFTTRSIESL